MDSPSVIFFDVLHIVSMFELFILHCNALITHDSSAMMHSVVPYLVGGTQLGASLPKTKEKLQLKFLQLSFLANLGMPRTLPPLKEVLTGLKRVERVFLEKLFLSSRM